jgi:hypothetical protein
VGEAKRYRLLRAALVAAALVVALGAWRATSGERDKAAVAETPPRIVSAGQLGRIVAETGHLVYWAGPMPGTVLTVSEGPEGLVQVRYLKDESELGREGRETLTVSSYPRPDPAAALANLAKSPGAIAWHSREGAEFVTTEEEPDIVYLASPEDSVQVEVYSPSPGRATTLSRLGRVRPAG